MTLNEAEKKMSETIGGLTTNQEVVERFFGANATIIGVAAQNAVENLDLPKHIMTSEVIHAFFTLFTAGTLVGRIVPFENEETLH